MPSMSEKLRAQVAQATAKAIKATGEAKVAWVVWQNESLFGYSEKNTRALLKLMSDAEIISIDGNIVKWISVDAKGGGAGECQDNNNNNNNLEPL